MRKWIRSLVTASALLAASWTPLAKAQIYNEWVNAPESVLIATVQSPAKGNCIPETICADSHLLNIGAGWEQVDAFMTHVSWLPGSNSGYPTSRLRAEVEAKYYDAASGDLEVELRGQIGNGLLGNFEYMIHFVIIATRDIHGAGYQPIRMEPFDNSCTQGGGDTSFGCSNSKNFPGSKTAGFTFVGFGMQSIDLHITDDEATEPVIVRFDGTGTGTTNSANTSQTLSCGIIDDQGLPFTCSNSGKILSAKPTVLAPGASPNKNEAFSVTIPMGTSRVEQEPAAADSMMGLMLLNSFYFERNGYSGAPYYAPTYYLGAGCGSSDFDETTGTFYVEWMAAWRDRTLSPWAWYDADIGCRRTWLMAEDP